MNWKAEQLIKKDITNAICVSGANITHMEHILKNKYVSKKQMRIALENQMKYLRTIENAKNELIVQLA
jgi:hypothetical protein